MKTILLFTLIYTLSTIQVLAQKDTSGFAFDTVDLSEDKPIFAYVEKMPSYPEGHAKMYQYIYSNLQYPSEAWQHKITGVVIVQFVVSAEGDIMNAKVARSIGYGCDEEALRLVNSMPRWNPGLHNNHPVPVTFTLPIKFVLK